MKFFAHRAGSAETYGNTLSGVLRCFALGLNIEIDVKRCADTLVCTHHDKLGSDDIGMFSLSGIRKFEFISAKHYDIRRFTVDGGIADRIPSLLEVLAAAASAPKKPMVILDVKEELTRANDVADMIKEFVDWTGTADQVIYGVHSPHECLQLADRYDKVLAFCQFEDINDFYKERVGWIRLWQDWLLDDEGQLTDPKNILKPLVGHRQVLIMTGSIKEAEAGECSIGQLRRLKHLGANAAIVNDPSLCVEGQFRLR